MDNIYPRLKDKITESPRHYQRLWHRILREGMKNGELRDDLDVKVVAYAILGSINWMYRWYERNGRLSIQEVAGTFTRTFLDGLAAQRTGKP